MTATPSEKKAFGTLRQFVRPRAATERCELCGLALGPEHDHLVEPATRQLRCSCSACAILFSGQQGGKFRRVPKRVQRLLDFHMTDSQWDALHIPIHLAFFFNSTTSERVVVLYPSPAGATESLLPLEAWTELVTENPILEKFEADVEALLVNRIGSAREFYRVPIDECYKLVGLIRANWRGLGGGKEVWEVITGFFTELNAKAVTAGGNASG
jgi:hypothetical protein